MMFNMTWEQFIVLLGIIGGGFSWFWTAIQNRQRFKFDEQSAVIKRLEIKIDECDKERQLLKARVSAIEAAIGEDMPTWRRTNDGLIVSVSRAFVRLFLTPLHLNASDLIGRRFEDLDVFPQEMLNTLASMVEEAILEGNSVRHSIPVNERMKITIIKVTSYSEKNETVFISAVCPERPITSIQ